VTVNNTPHEFDVRFNSTETGKEVTSLLNRSVGLAYSPAPSTPMQTADMRDLSHYIFTQSSLGVGENVYGLGERFGPFNKLGQNVSIWNADGGTSSDQAYKNVPFWISSKGYGVFIDTPDRVDLEIGSERCCRVQTSVQGQRLKWYVIYGPSPKEVLGKYAVLTGRAGRVPSWSFGVDIHPHFYFKCRVNEYRPMVEYQLHDRLRRENGDEFPDADEREGYPGRSIPLRTLITPSTFVTPFFAEKEKTGLLLAPCLPLVRLCLLQRALPRPQIANLAPQILESHIESLRLDKSVPRSGLPRLRARRRKRIPPETQKRRCLPVGSLAGRDGHRGLYESRGREMVCRMSGAAIRCRCRCD
jgi:hypothetical protein